jgi:hypothetical protein
MKRKSFRNRVKAFPVPFVRPITHPPNLEDSFFANGASTNRSRKIFVIREAGRLHPTATRGSKFQRILIFDDHPGSLQLVSRYHLDKAAERPGPHRSPWHLILGLFLILFLINAMFWPLLMAGFLIKKGDFNMYPGTAAQVTSVAPGAW